MGSHHIAPVLVWPHPKAPRWAKGGVVRPQGARYTVPSHNHQSSDDPGPADRRSAHGRRTVFNPQDRRPYIPHSRCSQRQMARTPAKPRGIGKPAVAILHFTRPAVIPPLRVMGRPPHGHSRPYPHWNGSAAPRRAQHKTTPAPPTGGFAGSQVARWRPGHIKHAHFAWAHGRCIKNSLATCHWACWVHAMCACAKCRRPRGRTGPTADPPANMPALGSMTRHIRTRSSAGRGACGHWWGPRAAFGGLVPPTPGCARPLPGGVASAPPRVAALLGAF